jgi:hypothetical protein
LQLLNLLPALSIELELLHLKLADAREGSLAGWSLPDLGRPPLPCFARPSLATLPLPCLPSLGSSDTGSSPFFSRSRIISSRRVRHAFFSCSSTAY